AHDVLVTRELLDPDRSAGVKTVGGDADLRAHAELAAVGELGGGVMQHDRAVDALQKALGGGAVFGHDRFGVRGAVARDVRNGRIHALDYTRGNDRVEVLGVPVVLARRAHARV